MKKRISTVLVAMVVAVAMASPVMAQGGRSSNHKTSKSSKSSSSASITVTVDVPTSKAPDAKKKKDERSKKKPAPKKSTKNRKDNQRGERDRRHGSQGKPAVEEVEQVYPMADADFAQLLAAIKAESFSSGKRRVLQMAAPYSYFSTQQVKTLVKAFDFSSDQVDAAVLLYPQIIDYHNFYQVLDAFTFESSKQEVRERLQL